MIRLFRVFIPKSVLAVIVLDFLLIVLSVWATVLVVIPDADLYLRYEEGSTAVILTAVGIMVGLYWQDAYNQLRVPTHVFVFRVMGAIGFSLVLQAILAYTRLDIFLPRRASIALIPVLLIILPLWRRVFGRILYASFAVDRLVFLGTDSTGLEIAERLRHRPEMGMTVEGFIDDTRPPGAAVEDIAPVLGPSSQLAAITKSMKPRQIVVNMNDRRGRLPVIALLDLRLSGMNIQDTAALYEQVFGRVCTRLLHPSHLIFSPDSGPRPSKTLLQSIYSLLAAAFGLVLVAPVMIVVAVAIRLTSPGPVLYRQSRVGLNGKIFTVYKFRSMVADAEAHTGAVWASKGDPRVTRVGAFIRKTRLDELPQLFNVLRGEMVLVGPRPERPEFVSMLTEQIPYYRQRHCVKPGLTGWAQINYKYGDTFEDAMIKLEYDLYYIKNVSLPLDLYVMFHTLKVMLASSHGQ